MYKKYFIVPLEMDGKVLSNILKKNMGFSKRIINNLKISGQIIINGVTAPANTILKNGDKIELIIQDDCTCITPEQMPLDIIYEDEAFLIINKPAGIVVHPTLNHYSGTLANGVSYYFRTKGLNIKIRAVNRLDKGTSGIVVFTKNQLTHFNISKQFSSRCVFKEYIAITSGIFTPSSGIISLSIARKQDSIIEREITNSGIPATTYYETIKTANNFSLMKLMPETGKTHQLRVHCHAVNCPIVGDTLYGGIQSHLITRQALHAYKIKFTNPIDNIQHEYCAPIPYDIQNLSNFLGIPIDFY